MINEYSFGRIVVDGKIYQKDIMILTDGTVIDGWRRISGHNLVVDDIQKILDEKQDVVIIGTGAECRMIIDDDILKIFKSRGVDILCLSTFQAIETYNDIIKEGLSVSAALHLSC